ncbi:acidic phospholipase A2 [Striga asiatica]|uniref:Acidic phospholipase A2 n=1 Tax=Striga asiatica TaxID=4170 RepID=A0A5A7RAD5_STRAF|nr:acidic phospholipase A2 [Striga asiatica]
MRTAIAVFLLLLLHLCGSLAGLLAVPAQPLNPVDFNTVPALPVQTASRTCRLDLSAELFGGVGAACGGSVLDRSRCCPVLAAWLFAAHARSALQIAPTAAAAASPAGSELPMLPDDSQNCVNSLQSSLSSRHIVLAQPNNTCDTILCFCGIRLHQITSLSCPAAFNITGGHRNATPTAAVRNLERNCRNSSYAGCTRCLGALQKVKGQGKNGTKGQDEEYGSERASKMLSKDCQLMGLTWLLARNKTAYIPTVSAVLRAMMYSAHPPRESTCSPDQENMPLAVDSLQFERYGSSSSAGTFIPVLPLIILCSLFVL